MIKNSYSALLIFVVLLNSCRQDQAQESIIYFNDFETSNTILENKIDTSYTTYHNSSERFFEFNGSRNLGRFERGGITLELEGIESHQFVKLEFDLYIHDNWEGNGARGNTEDVFILNSK